MLLVLHFASLAQWLLGADKFSPDWLLRARASQGYIYLILMLLIRPLIRRVGLTLDSLSLLSLRFLLTGIPLICTIAYAYSFVAGGFGRASFLAEHNFEMAFLTIILGLRQLLLKQPYISRAFLWPKERLL